MNEQLKDGEKERKQPGNGTQESMKKTARDRDPRTHEPTARGWDPRTLEEKEHTQPQGDKELEQVTCESDAKLDKNHEQSSGMQESIEAEGTEERVLALRTEMCKKSGRRERRC